MPFLSMRLLLFLTTATSAFLSPQQPRVPTTTFRRKMFTGIVEEMGHVVSLEERDDMTLWDGSKGKGTSLIIQASVVLEGAYLGYVVCHGSVILLLCI